LASLVVGRGGVMTVCGEPGIGKTRLLDEIAARAEPRGVRVLRASALPLERDVPFGVLAEALGDHWPNLEPPMGSELGHRQPRRAVAARLDELAGATPVILLLDDLHWADTQSCEIIARLVCRWVSGPVLGVFAFRSPPAPPALGPAIALAARERSLVQLELSPLTPEESDDLLGLEVAPVIRRSLRRVSGGNPFFLRELAKAGYAARPVPAAVRDVVADEIATLSTSAQLLLHGAAVAGDPIDLMTAAAAAGIPETDVAPLLDELAARALVCRRGAASELPGSADQLVFRHPIVGHAVYESIDEDWRTAAHARAADVLARRGVPLALRVHHIDRSAAQGDEFAAAILERAGRLAAGDAPESAVRWTAAALRVLPYDAPADRRRRLLTLLASNLAASGRTDAANEVLDEALALLPGHSSAMRIECIVTAARVQHANASRNDVGPLLTSELQRDDHAPPATALYLAACVEDALACEWDLLAHHARQALFAARAIPDARQTAHAAIHVAFAEKARGATASALEHAELACRLIDALPDDKLVGQLELFGYLGQTERELGHSAAAVSRVQRGLAIARATGQELFAVPLTFVLGHAQVSLGRLDEALESADVATREATRLGGDRFHALALMLACTVATRRGEYARAVQAGHDAAQAAQRVQSPLISASVNWRLAEAIIESGLYDQGIRRILELCGGEALSLITTDQRPHVYGILADAEIGLARLDRAEHWVAAAERLATELVLAPATADATRARAALLLARHDPRAAEIAIDASNRYAALGQQIDAAHATMLAGSALADAGLHNRAVEHLNRALVAFDVCGAPRSRDRAASELRALDRHSGRRESANRVLASTGVRTLTRRERQVAALVATGDTNRQIAKKLSVGEKTVETHLSNAFAKLGVSSRAEVAARWATHAHDETAAALAPAPCTGSAIGR
jgi:ATP/maltotriose-dependent transcriptional regulator MalT